MKQYKKVLEEVDQLEKCFCNQCGKEIPSALNVMAGHPDYQHFRLQWGYASTRDMETWSFDLCEFCLEKIIESFKIPAEIEKYY